MDNWFENKELIVKCIYCGDIVCGTWHHAEYVSDHQPYGLECAKCYGNFSVDVNVNIGVPHKNETVLFSWDISLKEDDDYIADYYCDRFSTENNTFTLFERRHPYEGREGHLFIYRGNQQLNIDQIKRVLELKAFL